MAFWRIRWWFKEPFGNSVGDFDALEDGMRGAKQKWEKKRKVASNCSQQRWGCGSLEGCVDLQGRYLAAVPQLRHSEHMRRGRVEKGCGRKTWWWMDWGFVFASVQFPVGVGCACTFFLPDTAENSSHPLLLLHNSQFKLIMQKKIYILSKESNILPSRSIKVIFTSNYMLLKLFSFAPISTIPSHLNHDCPTML